ncbi:MAG TPA: HAMP domain-containing sensor histidine kinase, partial [Longimicrobiales bacterium]
MSVSAAVFDLAAQLVDPETRTEAATRLAQEMGGESLILFLRDQPDAELYPLPGSPAVQLSACRPLLQKITREHHFAGPANILDTNNTDNVYGISQSPGLAVLLVGTCTPSAALHELEIALPLLELALRGKLKADQESQAKTEFLGTMGHELRTPLNAIGGYVQLLQLGVHGDLTAAQRDALDRVHRSQQNLLRLINDILSLARMEAGGMRYDIVNVDLCEVTRELFAILAREAQDNLRVDLALPDGEVIARADREKLDQILQHLVSNATKFTPAGGSVIIAAGSTDEYAFIEVSDTGVGVPADKLEAIFEAFVQVRGGINRTHEGSGLGLAIGRDLARGMNGDITVTSIEGVGSTFRLRLPLAARMRIEG